MSPGTETPIRMLMVNDDVAAAEAVVSHLRNAGLAVRPTRPASVGELSDLLDNHAYDLVLLSSPSTVISDSEAFRMVEAAGKDLPVLVEVENIDKDALLTLTRCGARAIVPAGQTEHLRDVVQREFHDLETRRNLRRLEAQVRETERRCDALIESSRDPIAYIHEGMHIRANAAYLEMFGYDEFEDIEGMSVLDMVAPAHVAEFKQLLKSLGKGEPPPPRYELEARDGEGNSFPAVMEFTPAKYEGEPCLQVVFRRQELDPALAKEVEELRRRDLATGLLNRQTFLPQLEHRVAEAATGDHEHALLLIELDQIVQLHQQVGLDNTDDLAAAVADRLREALSPEMVVARISENTYAVLLADSQYRHTLEVAERICEAFGSRLLETTVKTLSATVSVGGVQIGERIAQVALVLTRANESLLYANSVGGNRVQVFDPRASERVEEEQSQAWIERIREAIATDALKLHYQAIVNIHDDREQFHESLLRLAGHDGSLVLPAQFVPMAEERGLAGEIDRWSIRRALHDIAAQPMGMQPVKVLVKISKQSLEDEALVGDIGMMLAEAGVPASALVLQLPESKVFTSLRAAQRFNSELKGIGAAFCIEHFGTGLNSLQLLSHLQPGYLKLNEDFMDDFGADENRDRVAEIVQTAEPMGIACIARGVKDASTMTALFTTGVQYMQGDFVAPVQESMS